ncbi:MAG: hypothetical protein WCI72_01240 [archaeon]
MEDSPKIEKRVPNLQFRTSYLGAIKQLPVLCRAIQRVNPKQEVYLDCADFGGRFCLVDTLQKDMERIGVPLDSIHFNSHSYYPGGGLSVRFTVENDPIFFSENYLSLTIDPLKFERRKLLSAAEIKDLREKYGGGSDNVVLGGSLTQSEGVMLIDAAKKVIKQKPRTKFLLVPRSSMEDFVRKVTPSIPRLASSLWKRRNESNFSIVTELGILDSLYSICDTAIIGSTFEYGTGQNPLEPAFYGKPMLFGGQFRNNEYAYRGLEKTGLLKAANSKDELVEALKNPMSPKELKAVRSRVTTFFDSMQGAADLYAKVIDTALRGEPIPKNLERRVTNFLENKYSAWEQSLGE